jgi:hypothetical protein
VQIELFTLALKKGVIYSAPTVLLLPLLIF